MTTLLRNIGTFEWCRTSRGRLSPGERRRFVAATVLETLRSMPRLLLLKAGLWGNGPDPSTLTPPDTALTRRVLDAVAHLDPMLVEHSYRSYLFARALGVRGAVQCDDEALFVAAMLHDCAFPDADTTDDACFALRGAEAAVSLLQDSLVPKLLHDVLDAITLHLNPRVPLAQGALAHLLHAGVFIDTVGVGAWHLDRPGIQRVLMRHPRHSFIQRGTRGFLAHAMRVPDSRTRQLYRCGFSAAMRLSPWYAHEAHTSRRLSADAPQSQFKA